MTFLRMSIRLVIFALLVCNLTASATVPIEVVYGRGRNYAAIKLLTEAEDALKNDDVATAAKDADAAVRADPALYPALFTRAKVFVRQGKYALAIQDCSAALHADSTFVEAALLRANANAMLGNYAASLKEINHVITIRPRIDGLARGYDLRAWLEATCRDPAFRNGQRAIKDATTACKMLQWRDEDAIDTLAVAYAETGDFDSAIRYEEKALAIKDIPHSSIKVIEAHLAVFKQHRPLRF